MILQTGFRTDIPAFYSEWFANRLRAGYVLVGVGLISSVASILGHYIGAGLAIKNGSKIVRPTVIAVLLLLAVKVGSELLFPEFWS